MKGTNIILYQAVKHDILSLVLPSSKVLEGNGLLSAGLLATIGSTVSKLHKVDDDNDIALGVMNTK